MSKNNEIIKAHERILAQLLKQFLIIRKNDKLVLKLNFEIFQNKRDILFKQHT